MERYVIVDASGAIVCVTTDAQAHLPQGCHRLAAPQDFDEARLSEYRAVDGALLLDPAVVLERAKAARRAQIKRDAARAIDALAWRLERARERERLGLTGETVEAVLIEREAIRRASNRAEAAIDAAQDVASVEAIVFAVTEADRVQPRRLSRLEFLRRFTDAEMQAIVASAETSPALKSALMKWQAAEGIVLDDAATVAGVQALEIAGLIAKGRAAEILG